MPEFVTLEVEDGVATIRLDRPPANAIDRQVGEEIAAVAREAAGRADVGAVVLWGGPSRFAAGADIGGMAGLDPDGVRPWVTALGQACDELETTGKVTVAAINGYALGGGCELALACDLRVAAADAELGQPEVRIGVIPGAGGTQRLPHLIGEARAKDLILTGRRVASDEAAAIGLVTRVVPPGEVYPTAIAQARAFARGPRLALAAAKEAIAGARAGAAEGFTAERDAFCALFDTHDQKEGMAAFVQKRRPEFGGR
jgi:enoyl-CoA hydratase/carnithine racemase